MRHAKMLLAAVALAFAAPAPLALAQPAQIVIMDYERVVTASVAGRDVETKLRQIADQMQAELQPEQTAVQTEARNLQQATQGRSADQVQRDSGLQQRIQAFNTRSEAFRAQQVSRARDLEYTRQMALQELNRQLQPIVREVMTANRAGAVIDRGAVQIADDGVDVTSDIISRLDQRVRSINVTRQTAPAPQQQSGNR